MTAAQLKSLAVRLLSWCGIIGDEMKNVKNNMKTQQSRTAYIHIYHR